VFDPDIAPFANSTLVRLAGDLGIDASGAINEFTRTHWAIKEADLFKVLLKNSSRPKPKGFTLSNETPDPDLVPVMMPFSAEFNSVYARLQEVVAAVGMKCQRADDIWIHDYELGIAHALARASASRRESVVPCVSAAEPSTIHSQR